MLFRLRACTLEGSVLGSFGRFPRRFSIAGGQIRKYKPVVLHIVVAYLICDFFERDQQLTNNSVAPVCFVQDVFIIAGSAQDLER